MPIDFNENMDACQHFGKPGKVKYMVKLNTNTEFQLYFDCITD